MFIQRICPLYIIPQPPLLHLAKSHSTQFSMNAVDHYPKISKSAFSFSEEEGMYLPTTIN